MNIKQIFVYKIVKPCSSAIPWFTTNPDYAKECSENGCIVTCKTYGKKVFI